MSDTRTMSGAELKVCMSGLGLTSVWLADEVGVNVRSVLRWYEADVVPANVVAAIDRITARTSEEMHRLAHGLRTSGTLHTHRTDSRCSELNTLPASWHRALTYRVLEYVRSEGRDAAVAYT